jgi:hypothetical protein
MGHAVQTQQHVSQSVSITGFGQHTVEFTH